MTAADAVFGVRMVMLSAALASCTTTPGLCGVPYTDVEDAAGVEHDCSRYDPQHDE